MGKNITEAGRGWWCFLAMESPLPTGPGVMDMHVAKKQPPTEFHFPAFGKWHRALGKNWHVPLSHKVRIFKNWQGTRVFQIILYMSMENTIPWQKIWFTLYKEHGDMVKLHNRPSQKGPEKKCRLQFCPLQHEQSRMLVFKCSGYTMLSNVVWLYILKTTLWKLFRGMVLARFLCIDVRPTCTEMCLLRTRACPRPLLSWDLN